jgi:formate dehydrogenase major subunit
LSDIVQRETRCAVAIDGQAFEFPEGLTVLAALNRAGIGVPQLCHDERIRSIGACRMCLVHVAGQELPAAACHTPLVDGMRVATRTAELEALRRTNLSLLVRRYPAAAIAAEPNHPFHRLLAESGVAPPAEPGAASSPRVFEDDSHPYLQLDMERCIHCYRCVRICEELQGADIWQVWGRGPETRVAPRGGLTLLQAGCVSCGACSDTCPTGAIRDRRERTAERWTPSTCVYCGVGCRLNVGTARGNVVAIRPLWDEVNRGHLCVKGRYAFEFNHAPDRVTRPMIRRNGVWDEVTWDAALAEVARRLSEIIKRSGPGGGPQAVGILGSARATNEENYYAQKFARVVLGTHNVDCCARVCHQPTAAAMSQMLGTGAATNAFEDIEQAAGFLIVGCNPLENHPIVGARIRQAVRRGAWLAVIDPRRTELAEIADWHLAVRPGGNIPLFNALAAAILEAGMEDRAFLAERVDGLEPFVRHIRGFGPEMAAALSGVSAGVIRAVARLYASQKPAMCFHGLGVTEHLQGTEGVMGLVNLALLTGNIGRPGTGVNPLRGQNNVQGSAVMGCEPGSLTGAQRLDKARAAFEQAWSVTLPTAPGLNLLQMMDAAAAGTFKALWSIGYDVYLTLANEPATARALEQLELVVVQDLFMNETAKRFGHIFLPSASVFEKAGTFMNSERRVQRINPALPPSGDSRPDSWIIAQVAERMGFGRHFAHPGAEAIWNEVRSVWPAVAGLAYSRLTENSPHWPCWEECDPGTPVLHARQFAGIARASLRTIPFVPSPEVCDGEYPFRLTTGRHLYQFNSGTMTQRTANAELQSLDVLEISSADARSFGLGDGDWVFIESRHGCCELPVRLSDRVSPGELFTSFHSPELFVNRVTSSVRDRVVQAPEYKLTAVRLTRKEMSKVRPPADTETR